MIGVPVKMIPGLGCTLYDESGDYWTFTLPEDKI